MENLDTILNHVLFKLLIGVLLAFAIKLWQKRNGAPTHEDLIDELRTLLPPAVIVGAGYLGAGEEFMDALEAFLIALAVPLGVISGDSTKKEKQ